MRIQPFLPGRSLIGKASLPAAVVLVASLCVALHLTAAEPQRRATPYALTTLTIDYAVCSPNTYPDRIAMDSHGNLFVRHWGTLWKVDPTGSPLVFSEVLETGGTTYIQGIAVDSQDNVFVTGYTKSPAFPATHGAWDRTCGTTGTCFDGRGDLKKDAFVAKIRSDGTLAWATFLGGGLDDEGRAIAVDALGRAVVTGISEYGGVEGNFPVTPGAYQTTSSGGSDAFVTMLSADGSDLVFSTLLSDWYCPEPASVSLDPNGAIVVGGKASYHSVPVVLAFQSTCDMPSSCGFISEFSADGSALLFSTYLWGWSYSAWNEIAGVATGADGSIFAVGTTDSVYFPTTEGAFKCSGSADGNAFVARFSPAGALLYSTYLGGPGTGSTHGSGIVVDSRGRATVVGDTDDDSFPVTADGFQRRRGGGVTNGFVTTFNPSGSAVEFSSFLGGPVGYDSVDAIAAGPNGWLGLGGQAGSGFPVTRGSPPALSPYETTSFVARLTRSTSLDGATLSVTTTSPAASLATPAGATFNTLTPCRVLDTRVSLNGFNALALQPYETRNANVAGVCGIPSGAAAISANLTVTNVGAQGELVVFPADVSQPNTNAISFRAGRTRANNAVVSLSSGSTMFSVFNNSAATVDFILDVNGFFR